LPRGRYPDLEARRKFFDQALTRMRAIPGVTGAAISSDMPGLGRDKQRLEIEGQPPASGKSMPRATRVVVSPGFFETINLPILEGRDFTIEDGRAGRRAVIVTREFAEHYFPHEDALGKRFRLLGSGNEPGEWMTVVAVTAKLVQRTGEGKDAPSIFTPYLQEGYESMMLIAHSSGNISVSAPVRLAVHGLDPELFLFQVETLTAAVEHQQWFLHLFSKLFAAFAAIALAIAAVGLYAVMARAAALRTREIGVRMALGARPRHILAMMLWTGLWQMTCGFVAGLATAIPAARLADGLPFDVPFNDYHVFVAISAILIGVGILASWLPAHRAARLDPMVALREE
jgi:putative ABC transport system permease protein